MGCCCCCRSSNSNSKNGSETTIEMSSNVIHNQNSCKCGKTGKDIKTTNNGSFVVEGNGIVLGSCILDCDTAYFEVKAGKNPEGVLVGVKRFDIKKPSSLDRHLDEDKNDAESPTWYLKDQPLKEGDVVGVHWDQTDLPMLSFTLNGKELRHGDVNRVRPANEIYPAISLNHSSAELIFDENKFNFPAKSSKFRMIVCATSLI